MHNLPSALVVRCRTISSNSFNVKFAFTNEKESAVYQYLHVVIHIRYISRKEVKERC